MKKKTKATQKEGDIWINVHDDDVMRANGLMRPYKQSPRDPSVWSKTPNEKRILKNIKHSCKVKDMHFHSIPKKLSKVYGKLIIFLKKNKTFSKSTYSIECWQHDIQDILSKYAILNKKLKAFESVVLKYSWNGKTYRCGELPSWG